MQNPIGEADLEWILHRNCEGTEQLRDNLDSRYEIQKNADTHKKEMQERKNKRQIFYIKTPGLVLNGNEAAAWSITDRLSLI